jgi:hypothetical protein
MVLSENGVYPPNDHLKKMGMMNNDPLELG